MRLIIGAGLSGLAAALALLEKGIEDFTIIEKEKFVGGLASSRRLDGWSFDRTGHFLHFRGSMAWDIVSSFVPLEQIERRAYVYHRGQFVPYPFQTNLVYLSEKDRVRYLLSAIEAHKTEPTVQNFEDWIKASIGNEIAKDFLIPFNRKIYSADLKKLSPEQGGRYIPRPNIEELVRGAICEKKNLSNEYNRVFFYPKNGDIGCLAESIARVLEKNILYARQVYRIDPNERIVTCKNGERFSYSGDLISTIPMTDAVSYMSDFLPEEASDAVEELRATKIINFNVAIEGKLATDAHWIYVGDMELPFYRVGSLSNVSPATVPEGCASLWAEIGMPASREVQPEEVENLKERVLEDIDTMGLIEKTARVRFVDVDLISPAYVLFGHQTADHVAWLKGLLNELSVTTIGRFGGWKYDCMEGAIEDGIAAVDEGLLHNNWKLLPRLRSRLT